MSSQYSPASEMALMLFTPLPYPHSQDELWDIMPVRQHTDRTYIIGMICSRVEGSCSVAEPLAICLSGVEVDRRLHWKLLDLEKSGQQSVNVVKSGNNRMNRQCSPASKMALTLFAPSPLYPHPPRVSWDMYATRRHGINVVSRYSRRVEGSHLLEPLPICLHHPSSLLLQRWSLQKLSDVETMT